MDNETAQRIAQAEVNRRNQEAETKVWIPGHGDVSRKQRQVMAVIDSYGDGRFMLAKHGVTGDWCVWLRIGPVNGEPYPVLGLGQELPGPHEALNLMVKYDLKIHGQRIIEEMHAHNEQLKRQEEAEWEEQKARTAEVYLEAYKKEGLFPRAVTVSKDISGGKE